MGPPDNEHPNYHDYEELNAVYNHNDSISTVASPGIASSSPGQAAIQLASLDDVSMEDWGKAVGFTRTGKGRIFVKEVSPSERVITFATWAEP